MLEVTDKLHINRINGSIDRGGWECNFTALNDTDAFEINQRILVKWRGAFGGSPSVQRVAFDGYVLPTRIDFDRTGSTTQFIAQTSDGFLRRGWLQGIGFADVHDLVNPFDLRTNYHQYGRLTVPAIAGEEMTLGRIVQHILGYYDTQGQGPASNPDWVAHTNMVYHPTQNPLGWITLDYVETTPFDATTNPDGTMRTDRIAIRETDNLWERLTEIARSEFFEIYFDKNDTLHYTKHPMYRTVIPDPVMTFDEHFTAAPVSVEVRSSSQVRQVKLHAISDSGDNTLHSTYPESPTYVYGRVLDISRLRCNHQETLDSWCRRKYFYENREYTVRWTAPGLCGLLFEILDRVQVTYSGTAANGVHIDWDQDKFWITEIDVQPDDYGSGVTVFTLESENPCLDENEYPC